MGEPKGRFGRFALEKPPDPSDAPPIANHGHGIARSVYLVFSTSPRSIQAPLFLRVRSFWGWFKGKPTGKHHFGSLEKKLRGWTVGHLLYLFASLPEWIGTNKV